MESSKEKKGCIRRPLIKLDATSCPPNMLHLKKGLITKLMNQIVDWSVIQGNEHKIIDQMRQHKIPFTYDIRLLLLSILLQTTNICSQWHWFLYFSLYKEERIDGSHSGLKWSCPNIHDLMKILQHIKIDLILERVVDKHLSLLKNLSVVQLREECLQRQLDKSGKKVSSCVSFSL